MLSDLKSWHSDKELVKKRGKFKEFSHLGQFVDNLGQLKTAWDTFRTNWDNLGHIGTIQDKFGTIWDTFETTWDNSGQLGTHLGQLGTTWDNLGQI